MKYIIFALICVILPTRSWANTLPDGDKCPVGWVCHPIVKHKPHKVVKKKVPPKVVAGTPGVVVVGTRDVPEVQKNSLFLVGGVGPNGVSSSSGAGYASISTNFGAVAGLGYSRNVADHWALEAEALTNGTGLLGVGYTW